MPKPRKARKATEVEPMCPSDGVPESSLKSREVALTEELNALASLGRAKNELLNTVAHDLRAQLGAIFIWLTVLRHSSTDNDKAVHAMDVIETSAGTLAALLDELQDAMSILSGRLKLDTQRLQLGPVVEAATHAAQEAADGREVHVEMVLAPEAGLVSGDALRLQQVVERLLSNAIKFTPEHGRIVVRLEASGGQARLSVIDSGQGISPERLPQVFERAPRPESEGRSRGGNPGLGLAIAHELVRLHGGTLEASSPGPGQGSTFTVTIPRM